MTLEEYLEKVTSNYSDWDDDVELFYDYLSPGNAIVGKDYDLPNSDLIVTVVDEYHRRIEEEEVWVVLADNKGNHYKVWGEFTSWDGVSYEFKPVEQREVVRTEWV